MNANHPFKHDPWLKEKVQNHLDNQIPAESIETRVMQSLQLQPKPSRHWKQRDIVFASLMFVVMIATFLYYWLPDTRIILYECASAKEMYLNGNPLPSIPFELASKDTIQTKQTTARIQLSPATWVDLNSDTQITIGESRQQEIHQGSVHVVHSGSSAEEWSWKTPLGICNPVGTEFHLQVKEGEVFVQVIAGKIAFTTSTKTVYADAGQQINANQTDAAVSSTVSKIDTWWIYRPWTERLPSR